MNPPTTNTAKYKTMLCKHYETSKCCAFKEKCQFAHGTQELKSPIGQMNPMVNQIPSYQKQAPLQDPNKKGPNPQNYKIVKCKYWEKDGTCRYGTLCTFAHGNTELRTKTDNMLLGQPYGDMMNPMMGTPGMGQDPNMPMPNMMNPLAYGFDPNMMMAMQSMMGFPPVMDPSMMNMNQMMNPNYFMNYPGQQGGLNPSNSGGNI